VAVQVVPVVLVDVLVLPLSLLLLLLAVLLQASMRTGTEVAPSKRLLRKLALVCSMVVFYRVTAGARGGLPVNFSCAVKV